MEDRTRRVGWLTNLLTAVGGGLAFRFLHEGEVERATDALTAEAGRQITLQYESADAQDLKTLGMMAASIAGAAFVANAEHQWRSLWAVPSWILPLLLLAVAVGAFVMSLWHQPFQRGPSVPLLYRTFSGTMMEAKGRVLRELVEALEHNRALLRPKARWYKAGCWLLAAAVVAAAVAVVLSAVS